MTSAFPIRQARRHVSSPFDEQQRPAPRFRTQRIDDGTGPRGGSLVRTAWSRRLVLTVLAVVAFVAAVLVLGPIGLIPFGLLLAFSTDSDDEKTRRSVILTPRNLGLAAAMVAAFAWFWLGYFELTASTLVVIAGALIAAAARASRVRGPRGA